MSEADLSPEIIRTVPRKSGEQVTCRRVSTNYYRCNWWTLQNIAAYDNPSMLGSLSTTSRISRSHFLRAIKSGQDLSIAIITPTGDEQKLT